MFKTLLATIGALLLLAAGTANAAPPSHNDILKIDRNILRILSPKRVFITSDAFAGNLGGLAGADAICQSAAQSAGLTGQFMAWLSDSQDSPGTRFLTYSVGPYIDVRGRLIADGYGDLADGSIATLLLSDEFGEDAPGLAWTGTKTSGIIVSPDASDSCAAWTTNSADSQFQGLTGTNGSTGVEDDWTTFEFRSCDTAQHLYCFEQ